MADGAAAAAAPPRADALKAPPRYSLANAAWPDDQLTRLLPTARTLIVVVVVVVISHINMSLVLKDKSGFIKESRNHSV